MEYSDTEHSALVGYLPQTECLFQEDAYAKMCDAQVLEVTPQGGIVLDRTVFYATSGGQPGDSGTLEICDHPGKIIPITTAVYANPDKTSVVHVPADSDFVPQVGTALRCHINWQTRYLHMRMHTALHLLTVVLPHPVTGGAIGAHKSRLDFDMPEAPKDKAAMEAQINELIGADYPVRAIWIGREELNARPELVKTLSVAPPKGTASVRLVRIGDDVDVQPCGGTHVRSTVEIGTVRIGKIEKKGRQNRRVNILLS